MLSKAGTLEKRMLKRLVGGIILRDLRRSYRRITLVGEVPLLNDQLPLVLYANHHGFYDGYVGWLIAERIFRRSLVTWMQEWDTFPLFAPLGALPFPVDDGTRRAASMRRTKTFLEADSQSVFLYFPEGILHPASEGILPFDADNVCRLARLLPDATWAPMVFVETSRCDARPVLLVSIGKGIPGADGTERERLEHLLSRTRATPPHQGSDILTGRRSANERHTLRPLAKYFHRFI